MLRALIAGTDPEEIADLGRAAYVLFGASCQYYALEIDSSSTDPELAWGTARLVVRHLSIRTSRESAPPSEPVIEMAGEIERPLGEDGDAAPTILDAAHHLGVDVIVTAVRPQGWISKLFSGSAALDLVAASDIPVVTINRTPRS